MFLGKLFYSLSGEDEVILGVATIYDLSNCGNRLQNYALLRTLQLLGYSSITCRIGASRNIGKRIRASLGEKKRFVLGRETREDRSLRFTHRNIPTIDICPDVIERKSTFGGFVLGSDQIWNPSWNIGSRTDGFQCLSRIPSNRKAAYAASFGINWEDLSKFWRKRYAAWLRTFDPQRISMREDEGARIVRELTGWDVPVVLDPVMLLDAEDWEAIERKPRISGIDKPYCFAYVLGDDSNRPSIRKLVVGHQMNIISASEERQKIGPAEFVWLIRNARLVYTDSFHATVFSLLFHRPFLVAERIEDEQCDMSSRFNTLSRLFSLESRKGSSYMLDTFFQAYDWRRFQDALVLERERSIGYLESTLSRMNP